MKQDLLIPFVTMVMLLAAGCSDKSQSGRPTAVAMTDDALGHYCQMALSEHPGPKAQVHLEGLPNPLFFSQVRDAIAYKRMPEQSYPIRAIYVSDMEKASSWEEPGVDNWAAAEDVFYVADSKARGGMGAPELVPFARRQAAEAFAAENGGSVLTLGEIPDHAVLAPVELSLKSQDDTADEVPMVDDQAESKGKR